MIIGKIAQKNLEFSVKADPALPTVLYGDEMRIRQILVNLLSNEVKYKESFIAPNVKILVTDDNDMNLFIIKSLLLKLRT